MRQIPVTLTISSGMDFQIVLTSIDLDHQTMLQANEIDDEPSAR
jgi:hypothetical protein